MGIVTPLGLMRIQIDNVYTEICMVPGGIGYSTRVNCVGVEDVAQKKRTYLASTRP